MSDLAQGTTLSLTIDSTPTTIGQIVSIGTTANGGAVDVSDLDSTIHEYIAGLIDDEITLTVIGNCDDLLLHEASVTDATITWTDTSTTELGPCTVVSRNKRTGVAGRIETSLTIKLTA